MSSNDRRYEGFEAREEELREERLSIKEIERLCRYSHNDEPISVRTGADWQNAYSSCAAIDPFQPVDDPAGIKLSKFATKHVVRRLMQPNNNYDRYINCVMEAIDGYNRAYKYAIRNSRNQPVNIDKYVRGIVEYVENPDQNQEKFDAWISKIYHEILNNVKGSRVTPYDIDSVILDNIDKIEEAVNDETYKLNSYRIAYLERCKDIANGSFVTKYTPSKEYHSYTKQELISGAPIDCIRKLCKAKNHYRNKISRYKEARFSKNELYDVEPAVELLIQFDLITNVTVRDNCTGKQIELIRVNLLKPLMLLDDFDFTVDMVISSDIITFLDYYEACVKYISMVPTNDFYQKRFSVISEMINTLYHYSKFIVDESYTAINSSGCDALENIVEFTKMPLGSDLLYDIMRNGNMDRLNNYYTILNTLSVIEERPTMIPSGLMRFFKFFTVRGINPNRFLDVINMIHKQASVVINAYPNRRNDQILTAKAIIKSLKDSIADNISRGERQSYMTSCETSYPAIWVNAVMMLIGDSSLRKYLESIRFSDSYDCYVYSIDKLAVTLTKRKKFEAIVAIANSMTVDKYHKVRILFTWKDIDSKVVDQIESRFNETYLHD